MALTDLTRISTSGIATGSTIDSPILRKDVSLRGSQVGVTSALFDASEDELNLKDNVKLTFGNATNGDLEIYHSNINSIINDKGTGNLQLQVGGSTKLETNPHGVVVTGILTATSFSGGIIGGGEINVGIVTCTGLDLNGNGDVSGNFVIGGDLTVNGTTTTLDTNLTEVDRIEVGANSNTLAGIAVTQSGSADIVRLYDGASQVVTVDDTGNVGLGSTIPASKLDMRGLLTVTRSGSNTAAIFSGGGGAGNIQIKDGDTGTLAFISVVGGVLHFQTSGSSYSKKLTIDTAGKIGIGTDNPNAMMQIISDKNAETDRFNSSNYHLMLQNTGNDTDEAVGMGFAISDDTDKVGAAILHERSGGGSAGSLQFYTNSNGASVSERLRITSDGTVHTAMTGTAPSWLGNTIATREKFSVFQGANFAEACFNIDVDNANSFLSHNMYYDSEWKIKKSGQPVRHLEIGTNGWTFMTGADGSDNTASALTNKFRIRPSGRIQIANNNEDIDMAGDSAGQIQIDGNGYTGAIALNSQGMFLYHNSSTRFIGIGVNETEVGRFSTGGYEQRFSNTSTYSSTTGQRRGIYVFNDGETTGCYASLELGATNSNDHFGSTILNSISTDDTNYSNHFAIQTRHGGNYGERLRIKSDGDVGIGYTDPNARLHIASGNSSAVGDATNPALQIGSTTNYRFAVHTTNEQAIIANKNGDDGISFHTKSANGGSFGEAVHITSGGDLSISDGNLVVASGHGIDFSATSHASGKSSELLDDYEEGTWTPNPDGSGTINGTSITYAGYYTKVGRLITIEFYANNSAGDIEIPSYKVFSGLPFAAASGNYGTGRIMTEDGEQLARQGDVIVGGSNFLINKCGSSSGTVRLGGTVTYIAT